MAKKRMESMKKRVYLIGKILSFCLLAAWLFTVSLTLAGIKDKPVPAPASTPSPGPTATPEPFNNGVPFDSGDQEITKNFKDAATALTNLANDIKNGRVTPPQGISADDLEKCEDCLKKMLEQKKVEKETGTANEKRGATTQTTFKKGEKRLKCDPQRSDMKVNPATFSNQNVRGGATGGLKELAALLAHECKHTTQGEEPKGKVEREKEAYTFQANVLEAFVTQEGGSSNAPPRLNDAKQDVDKKAKEPPSDPPKIRTPVGGFDSTFSADGLSEYTVFYSAPELRGRTSATPGISTFPLDMAHPLSVILLHGLITAAGNEVILISGIDTDGTTGVIEAVEVSAGIAIGKIFTTKIPNSHPLSMAYDASANSVFVLDTLQDIVFILVSGVEGIPKTPLSTFYATKTQFSQVRKSFDLSLNAFAPGSIILSEQNSRGIDTVNLSERLTALFDTDSDGIADNAFSLQKREAVAFPPGFLEPLSAGLHAVLVGGTFQAQVKVQATDAAGTTVFEVLGQGTIGHNNTKMIHLSRRLIAGEFVQLVDLTNGYSEVPVLVSP